MTQITLDLPETLHQQLTHLAKNKGVPVQQFIVDALASQTSGSYKVHALTDKDVMDQRVAFTSLLQQLGKASAHEIEAVLQEREAVDPEPGLTPDTVDRLRRRISEQKRR